MGQRLPAGLLWCDLQTIIMHLAQYLRVYLPQLSMSIRSIRMRVGGRCQFGDAYDDGVALVPRRVQRQVVGWEGKCSGVFNLPPPTTHIASHTAS
jgi:hypothetical protein